MNETVETNDNQATERDGFATSDWVLGLLFAALVGGSVAALTYDFRTLSAQSAQFSPDTPARLAPAAPPVPGREDQLRRYSPGSSPSRQPVRSTDLPGFQGDPQEALGQAMRFFSDGDGSATGIGRITLTTYDDFEAFIDANADVALIVFQSPGGSVRDAIGVALGIRERDIATEIVANGYCASSCPLAFSGGIERVIDETANLGVHQVFTPDATVGTVQDGMQGAQFISSQAQQLLDDMGVDPRAWIEAMATPPEQLYVFSDEELDELNWRTSSGEAGS
ncbi:MAG: hypothetical protein AAF739_08080 [Pseudomonadota bacterium]